MGRYVALLRGINVGGNNLIRMPALKACFEEHGYTDVATFIQSGNVLFSAREPAAVLVKKIEKMLSDVFAYPATVVLRSRKQLRDVVARAPAGFGTQPDKYRYDVIFLKEPLRAAVAMKSVPLREGVDAGAVGPGVLYFSRLISRATQSQLTRIIALPIYKQMTIRNWNTTTKLAALLDAAAA